MATISATVLVYFTTDDLGNKIIECFPNKEIHLPPKSTAQVTFEATATSHPQPSFNTTSIQATGSNTSKITFPIKQPTQFVAVIDNTAGAVDVGVKFTAVYTSGSGSQVINGDSTIRNKGNSIFALLADAWRPLAFGFGFGVLVTWVFRSLFGPHV